MFMLRPSDEILFLTGAIIGLSAIFTILLPLILKAFLVVLVVETGVLASFSIKAIEDEEKTQIADKPIIAPVKNNISSEGLSINIHLGLFSLCIFE